MKERTTRSTAVPARPKGQPRTLSLPQAIGNRATAALLQRAVATRPRDLKPLLGTGGMLKGALGTSTFASIHSALADYHKAGDAETQTKKLQKVNELCMKWLNQHSGSQTPGDIARRGALEKLVDEVAAELAALGRSRGQAQYQEDLKTGGPSPTRLKGLMSGGADAQIVRPKVRAEGDKYRLTDAEIQAIRIFTANDYAYINPAVASSSGWLTAQRKEHDEIADATAKPDKMLFEEGRLHAGVAMQGLAKLPVFDSQVYRGARFSKEDFEKQYKEGKTLSWTAFSSATVDRTQADVFARQTDNPIAVIHVIPESNGRDISKLSYLGHEKEVLLMPGTKFRIASLKKIPPAGRPDKEWWEAKLELVKT